MLAKLTPTIRERLARWLFQVGGRATHDVVLVQRRVFILPTRQGVLFGLMLLVMLTACINFNLSLGYVLTFLLAAMGFNAMLHTYRNLAHLRVVAGPAAPVFAGERARFTVEIGNPRNYARYAVALARAGADGSVVDVGRQDARMASVHVDAPARGVLRPGRLTLSTSYPLGLYRAWSYLELDLQCIVYPRPAPPGLPRPPRMADQRSGTAGAAGQDDFGGLRPYHPGDSPRHIAWKASARDDKLLTKQFTGHAAAECWLDWSETPATLDTEQRLSWLARWVLDAHAASVAYGLRLPHSTLPIGHGELHRARCLEALALFPGHER